MAQCAVWDFRANRDYYTVDYLKTFMKDNAKKWSFQLERGDNGYEHWQGRFSLIKKRNKKALISLWSKEPNYMEPTLKENHKDEFFYAMKKDTRIDGPYKDDDKEIYIPRQFRNIKLYEWQQQIVDSINDFNDRKINLIYDPVGNNGKSTVSALCELVYGGIDMPPLNDYKELVQLACNICQDGNNRTPKIMLFDMPRAVKKDQLNGLYSAIEQIKKGKLYDIRHHYKCYWIDSPVVWVFTNVMPDTNYLSADRWTYWTINNKKLDKLVFGEDEPEVHNPLDDGVA